MGQCHLLSLLQVILIHFSLLPTPEGCSEHVVKMYFGVKALANSSALFSNNFYCFFISKYIRVNEQVRNST